jgi:hypothetical protein
VITKDYCTYTMIILRHEKILRDHGRGGMPTLSGTNSDYGYATVGKPLLPGQGKRGIGTPHETPDHRHPP